MCDALFKSLTVYLFLQERLPGHGCSYCSQPFHFGSSHHNNRHLYRGKGVFVKNKKHKRNMQMSNNEFVFFSLLLLLSGMNNFLEILHISLYAAKHLF